MNGEYLTSDHPTTSEVMLQTSFHSMWNLLHDEADRRTASLVSELTTDIIWETTADRATSSVTEDMTVEMLK